MRWQVALVPGPGAGDDDELILENRTEVSWRVYHHYQQLGIIDADEQRAFQLHKHGSLSVRQYDDGDDVEYLMLRLKYNVTCVHIYRRQMGKDVEVYDLRVA